MNAAILTVGTELTRGELVNTNASWLAERLTSLGFEVTALESVDDDEGRVVATLRRLGETHALVLVTGGLGPTTDDLTAACAARAAGVSLRHDETAAEAMRRRFAALKREPGASDHKQAMVPEGSEVLGNPAGMAAAFALTIGRARCFFMPGVPREVHAIFDELLVQRLGPLAEVRSYQLALRTYGMPEATVGERLAGLEAQCPGLTLGYRVVYPEVWVKCLVRAADGRTARTQAERVAHEVRARLGDVVYGEEQDSYALAVGRALRARGATVAVAESCTGGLVGALLTSVAGSSDYLLCDVVSYANRAKSQVLGVPDEVLQAYGAVSPECVQRMAEGARRLVDATLGVAITGVAGPGGGSDRKPVGLVYFALATAHGTRTVEKSFTGERERIQRGAAFYAMSLLREACLGPVPVAGR